MFASQVMPWKGCWGSHRSVLEIAQHLGVAGVLLGHAHHTPMWAGSLLISGLLPEEGSSQLSLDACGYHDQILVRCNEALACGKVYGTGQSLRFCLGKTQRHKILWSGNNCSSNDELKDKGGRVVTGQGSKQILEVSELSVDISRSCEVWQWELEFRGKSLQYTGKTLPCRPGNKARTQC